METFTYKNIQHTTKRKRAFFLLCVVPALAGMVFLFGGVSVASAQPPVIPGTWAFNYQIKSGGSGTGAILLSAHYSTKLLCEAVLANPGSTIAPLPAGCRPYSTQTIEEVRASEAAAKNKTSDAAIAGLNCSIGVLKNTDLSGCFPIGVYYLVYKPSSWVLILAAKVFDFTLFLSINKQYVDQPFVNSAWEIMRDVSNMAFIFILLYTGISTMLGAKEWKRVVIQVIIIALLVNFSLFFTKVVIDAGNVLAVGIYSSFGPAEPGKMQKLSDSLVNVLQPQSFVAATVTTDPFDAIVIFFVAGAVALSVSWVLFKVALLFIGRLIAFWFLMIVSPFAFVSSTFPKGNKFQAWLDMLLAQAFVAPVFLFMLYIILKAITIKPGILEGFISSSGLTFGNFLTNKIFIPALIAVFIFVALSKAKDFAESMAGEFGKLGAKIGMAVVGVAAGVATGGAGLAARGALAAGAMVGRKVIGGAAQKIGSSGALRNMASNPNSRIARFVGRQSLSLADKTSKASFDARGLGFVQSGMKRTGINAGGVPKTSEGGLVAAQKRKAQADLAFADSLKVSAEEKRRIAAQADPRYTAAQNRVGAEQDAAKATKEASRTSPTATASERAKADKETTKLSLDTTVLATQASIEGMALTTLTESLNALRATEVAALAEKTKADAAYTLAYSSTGGSPPQAIADALAAATVTAARATADSAAGEVLKNTAQTTFNNAHLGTIDAAKTLDNAAKTAMDAAAQAYAISTQRQAELTAEAQLKTTQKIISEAEKAADRVSQQRREAYANEVSQRGWTSDVFTEGDRVRQSETAAAIRAGTPADKRDPTMEELLKKLVAAQASTPPAAPTSTP